MSVSVKNYYDLAAIAFSIVASVFHVRHFYVAKVLSRISPTDYVQTLLDFIFQFCDLSGDETYLKEVILWPLKISSPASVPGMPGCL